MANEVNSTNRLRGFLRWHYLGMGGVSEDSASVPIPGQGPSRSRISDRRGRLFRGRRAHRAGMAAKCGGLGTRVVCPGELPFVKFDRTVLHKVPVKLLNLCERRVRTCRGWWGPTR